PVTATLTDVQKHLRTPISPSTILLGHSLESDLRALHLALLLHLPRGRPPKPELTWLTHKDREPGGHNPKEDARPTLSMVRPSFVRPSATKLTTAKGAGLGSSGRIMRHAHGIAIVDHGNLGAWHVSSATASATTVVYMDDVDVLDGLLGALDFHEFVLGQRLLGFGGFPGCVWPPLSILPLTLRDVKAYPTALHAALPPRAVLLFFSGHGDPRSTTTLAARRAEYQLGQNQRHGNQSSSGTGSGRELGTVRCFEHGR
ncbi:hypothetical protein EDB84DRAFT_1270953, partial [Lactarius hengduanensis]